LFQQVKTNTLRQISALVFASDPSAVIEHTKNVMFLEDGDLIHVEDGRVDVRKLLFVPRVLIRMNRCCTMPMRRSQLPQCE
jgi:hypothetical protein